MKWWLVNVVPFRQEFWVHCNDVKEVFIILEEVAKIKKEDVVKAIIVQPNDSMKADAAFYGSGMYLLKDNEIGYVPVNLRAYFIDNHCQHLL